MKTSALLTLMVALLMINGKNNPGTEKNSSVMSKTVFVKTVEKAESTAQSSACQVKVETAGDRNSFFSIVLYPAGS